MNILGTGLSGLVGSRIVEMLSGEYIFENLSLETGVDITKKEDVDRYFSRSDAPWVFHLAAYTDVQGAEKERSLGTESVAWKVNVLATEYIIENCSKYHKKLLYIDTDYAFDGTSGPYAEDAIAHPLGWYATTKTEGASRILTMGDQGLVIRISNPYRAHPVGKKDFVHKMLERLQQGLEIKAPSDQLFVPTFIDDLALAIEALVKQNAHGVYHVVSDTPLSPFDAALSIAQVFSCDEKLVSKTTFSELFKDRAPAPQYSVLTQGKIKALGIAPVSFHDGLLKLKEQEI